MAEKGCTAAFVLPAEMHVTVNVYDVLGRAVETVAEGQADAGEHRIVWNAAAYAGGVYFCRIHALPAGNSAARPLTAVQRLVLAR